MENEVTLLPSQPEPCLLDRCYSPTACGGWGYCRERNRYGVMTEEDMANWRRVAAQRRAEFLAQSPTPALKKG